MVQIDGSGGLSLGRARGVEGKRVEGKRVEGKRVEGKRVK